MLVRRWPERLRQQRQLPDRQHELAALGLVHIPLHPDDVADVEAEDAVVCLLSEVVYAHDDLDLTGQVAQVQERRIGMLAAGDQPASDLIPQLGVPALVELIRVVRVEHVFDPRTRIPQGDGRIRVDALRAHPLELGAPFVDLDDGVLLCVVLLVPVLYRHTDDPLNWVALVKRSSRIST